MIVANSADGLEWASAEAPSPIMREFALLALQRGWTYGEIARRLNDQESKSLGTINVSRHFAYSKEPRRETVDSYRRLLGATERHVRAVQRCLMERDFRWAARAILHVEISRIALDSRVKFSNNVTIDAVRAKVRDALVPPLSDSRSAEALRAYVLVRERLALGVASPVLSTAIPTDTMKWWSGHLSLLAFADLLRRSPGLNLFTLISGRPALYPQPTPGRVEEWISVTSALLRDTGQVRSLLKQLVRILDQSDPEFLEAVVRHVDGLEAKDWGASSNRERTRMLFGGVSLRSIIDEIEAESAAEADGN